MPKTKIDYSKTIIYKIECKDPDVTEFDVGHTTNFSRRKNSYKNRYPDPNKDSDYKYILHSAIQENGGWENWTMTKIKDFPCKSRFEAQNEAYDEWKRLDKTKCLDDIVQYKPRICPICNTTFPYCDTEYC